MTARSHRLVERRRSQRSTVTPSRDRLRQRPPCRQRCHRPSASFSSTVDRTTSSLTQSTGTLLARSFSELYVLLSVYHHPLIFHPRLKTFLFCTVAFLFFSRTDSTDSPDCLSTLLSISVCFCFLFKNFFSHFLVFSSVR